MLSSHDHVLISARVVGGGGGLPWVGVAGDQHELGGPRRQRLALPEVPGDRPLVRLPDGLGRAAALLLRAGLLLGQVRRLGSDLPPPPSPVRQVNLPVSAPAVRSLANPHVEPLPSDRFPFPAGPLALSPRRYGNMEF